MMPDLLRVTPLKLHVRNATQKDGAAPLYEVFCRWRNETLKLDDAFTFTEWSVWRSYDAFQALDAQLRAQRQCQFAKMMVTVAFAPEHRMRSFFHQDQTARFLDKRQKELDYYLQRILLFSGVSEFVAGTGSRVLADFVEADAHVDCTQLLARTTRTASLSIDARTTTTTATPIAALSDLHAHEALRTLHVDMHAAFSPSSSYASSSATVSSFDAKRIVGGAPSTLTRADIKQAIEDELAVRTDEHVLKRFRKRARAFRRENDPHVAAESVVTFVTTEFDDRAFATWLLERFVETLKPGEKRVALLEAISDAFGDDNNKNNSDAAQRKARKAALKLKRAGSSKSMTGSIALPPAASASNAKLSRKQSSKEIMARVTKYARGNDEHVESFKVAAKALGSHEMTTTQFVAFVRTTFSRSDARELLLLVADVVPLPHVERELRDALAI